MTAPPTSLQCTVRVPGVIPEGDDHRCFMATPPLSIMTVTCYFYKKRIGSMRWLLGPLLCCVAMYIFLRISTVRHCPHKTCISRDIPEETWIPKQLLAPTVAKPTPKHAKQPTSEAWRSRIVHPRRRWGPCAAVQDSLGPEEEVLHVFCSQVGTPKKLMDDCSALRFLRTPQKILPPAPPPSRANIYMLCYQAWQLPPAPSVRPLPGSGMLVYRAGASSICDRP